VTRTELDSVAGESTAHVARRVPVPPRLFVPLVARPGGAPPAAKPVWTAVRRGEALTEVPPENFAAPLAPADGNIVAVEAITLLDGREVPAVVLETKEPGLPDADKAADGGAGGAPPANLFGEIGHAERGAWIEALRHAGVWADRWTSPDLLGQLHQSLRRPIDTVLCCVLDPDRALPLQSQIADTCGAELAAGVDMVAKIAGANRAWVLVDDASPHAFREGLRQSIERTGARLVALRNDYPQANPTLLLFAVLGRRLPPGHLPTETGALVLDAAAAVAVGRHVLAREPMLTVPLAVSDARLNRAHFVDAAVGTPVSEVLTYLGLVPESCTLYGGPPPRDLIVSASAVVSGTESCVYAADPAMRANPDPCIRCGWCVEGCPVHIHPAVLLEAMQSDDMYLADEAGLHACIDCGICSYICPARLPLLGGIRTLRKRWAEHVAAGR
jgi:electron transport complex protein RnfC